MDSYENRVEYLKERAKLYIELMKVSAAFSIAVGGGVAGLLFKLDTNVSLPLIGVGLWVLSGSLFAMVRSYLSARECIEEIRRWREKS